MTTRECLIARAVLNFLHAAEYGQRTVVQIRLGAFNGVWNPPPPSAQELDAVIEEINAAKFISGIPSPYNQNLMLWKITTLGEAARLEMQV